MAVDNQVVHGGKWAARIEGTAASAEETAGISKTVPVEFAGRRIVMRAFLRTENVTGFAGLWLREDGPVGWLEFNNMRGQLKGTSDWQQYEISVPLNSDATALFFAVLVSGSGKAWVDDIQVLVDGKPLGDAPKVERPKTPLETDHEFDGGSGIAVKELTDTQIANLVMLGKVWGFLKYHHPEVTGGRRHWDYDLFRVLPAGLAAKDRSTAQAAVAKWIAGLGGRMRARSAQPWRRRTCTCTRPSTGWGMRHCSGPRHRGGCGRFTRCDRQTGSSSMC